MTYDNNQLFEKVPGRVQAAMDYIRHCMWLTDPVIPCSEFKPKGRPLSPPEQAAYLAALEATRLYFSGEMDFAAPVSAEVDQKPAEDAPCAQCGKKRKCKC